MNYCSIGRPFGHKFVTNIEFHSTETILVFDAAFIDCAAIANYDEQEQIAQIRRNEFSEFLASGRTIVVFSRTINLKIFLPIEKAKVIPISGHLVDFKGPDYLKTFWNAIKGSMKYFTCFEEPLGLPFLYVHSTTKVVASLCKYQRGHIIFLPWMDISPLGSVNEHNNATFVNAFQNLNQHLVPQKSVGEPPAWSAHYGWQYEHQLRDELIDLQKKQEALETAIKKTTNALDSEDKLKILFTAKGDILLDVVIEIFRSIGAKADRGEPGRDDIIIEFEGKSAVAEVKGKKKSAAEEDAAQLEKWVAGFKSEKGNDPKGILLVNAFCDTPLAERNDEAFPHQMLKYSKQREHCLMTTLQLLGLILEVRAHPESRIELVTSIFTTVGVYQQFSDWKKFLISKVPIP